MNKFLCIFLISSFFWTSILEAKDFSVINAMNESSTTLEIGFNSPQIENIEKGHCDDCHENDCHDEKNCCQSLCKCSSAYITPAHNSIKNKSYKSLSQHNWHHSSKYCSPSIDPALKPPLFS